MKKGFGGLFVLLVGFILLGNTTGFLSWNVWDLLWKFWPVFIIFAGIEMLDVAKQVKFIIAAIVTIIVLGVVVTTLQSSQTKMNSQEELNPESFMVIPTSYQNTHRVQKARGIRI